MDLLATANSAAMNMGVQIFLQDPTLSYSIYIKPVLRFLGHMVVPVLIF